MLMDARDKRFEVVAAKHPDRLMRGVEYFIPIQMALESAGVTLEFAEETQADTSEGQAMLQFGQIIGTLLPLDYEPI